VDDRQIDDGRNGAEQRPEPPDAHREPVRSSSGPPRLAPSNPLKGLFREQSVQSRTLTASGFRAKRETMTGSLLCPDAFLSPFEIDAMVMRALTEDLGRAGDVTSVATIPESLHARAVVVAREAGVIAGLPLVAATFSKLAPEIEITAHQRDGANVARTALMTVTGPARAILAGERVALNLLGRLSGVATATPQSVRRVAGTRTPIGGTRKTP